MATKHRSITVEDLWQIERVGALALAPDGSQAVTSLTSYSMQENKASSSLWLLSTFGGEPRRLTSCGEKDGQAAWSPDGSTIAFVAKREQEGKKDEAGQLYLIAPDGGEARRLTQFAPGIEAFKWFPDGKRIAFVAWVWPELKGEKAQAKRHKEFKDRKETGYATSESLYRYWDHHVPMGRVAHLLVLDVASGRIADLFEGTPYELSRAEPDANAFDISPDGRRIAFAYDPNPDKRLDNCRALFELEVRTRKFTPAVLDKAWDLDAPRYSPDGETLAFIAANQGKKHTMPPQLALLPRTGRWKVISANWDHSVNAPLRWAGDASAVHFTAEQRGRNHLWRFSVASSAAKPDASVVATGGWVHSFDVSPAGTLVYAADSMNHPARVHTLREGAAPQRIEQFNDALLAKFRFGKVDEITLRGAQGDDVQMWVIYPPGFDPKKKYPVLHSIHGGPHAAAGDTFHYRWNTHVFAAEGYVVASVNYHGSSGFGYGFLDSITYRWGELELQDVEAGTDWLLKQHWADRKRVFATGGSYGGYMVAWMNGHVKPGRYQAYVCHAGCFDWVALSAGDTCTWLPRELGAAYWEDMSKVHSQSPHAFVAPMKTPTLVVHGALDYRVPDQQGLAYYNTLKARGVDARLLWFPDENHWILKPRNSKLWYEEYFGWLARHGGAKRRAR
jgi:dipeptidyl aminopeptidase/acylaminoacyl peptidase